MTMESSNGGGETSKQGAGSTTHSAATAPSISLPKGGGALKDISQQFQSNPITGTGSLPISLPLSKGREGFGPMLSLQYDSGSGNGIFGFGWTLSIPSVTRKTSHGIPRYDDLNHSDVFIISGIGELVPVQNQASWEADLVPGYRVQTYRLRVEKSFSLIQLCRNVANPADVHWRLTSPDNILSIYGKTKDSRIFNPEAPAQIFEWLLSEAYDDRGNAVAYRYARENGLGVDASAAHESNRGAPSDSRRTANLYFKRALYGNVLPILNGDGKRPRFVSDETLNSTKWMFEAVLDYGEHQDLNPTPQDAGSWNHRPDAFSSYRSGFEVRTTRLCKRFLMFHHFPDELEVGNNCLVQSLNFVYNHDAAQLSTTMRYTFMTSVKKVAYRRKGDGYIQRELPPIEFEYTQPVVSKVPETIDSEALENLPAGFASSKTQFVDLFGEGISSILTEFDHVWYYKRNVTPLNLMVDSNDEAKPQFRPAEIIAHRPRVAAEGLTSFHDISSSGILSVMEENDNTSGFYKSIPVQEGWENWKAIPQRLNSGPLDLPVQTIDINGDGLQDTLDADGSGQRWHQSLGEDGFSNSYRLDQYVGEDDQGLPAFSQLDQGHLRVADFSGDGLPDLARIWNGSVCYWPNLGYGRFGNKVTLDNSPWFDHDDLFDVQNVILADVDGSGTSDLIYIHHTQILIFVNIGGNKFLDPITIDFSPKLHGLDNITTADIHGNGTASLVFSTLSPIDSSLRSMQYIRLMGNYKPYLLTSVNNNMGAETRIHYTSSSAHYLRDKEAGNPWNTRLPFPINVVESCTVTDRISRQRFTSRFAYHHGYFDPIEREFRGFGMVEQWDAESFGTLSENRTPWDNESPETYLPPIHTKTWYHLGIVGENEATSYEREYFIDDNSKKATYLDHTMPSNIAESDWPDACRALAGAIIRTEMYSDDAEHHRSPKTIARSKIPYATSESNQKFVLLQPSGALGSASFLITQSESFSIASEREVSDPRCTHSIVIEQDKYGNVLKEIVVSYGRLIQDDSLPTLWDRDQQTETHALYKEAQVTNDIYTADCYRLPSVCQASTHELTGFATVQPERLFNAALWRQNNSNLLRNARRLSYHQTADSSVLSLRILQESRTLFRKDDLTGNLPLTSMESLALPGTSYTLAFTLDHISELMKRDSQPLIPNLADLLIGVTYNHGGYITGEKLATIGHFPTPTVPGQHWIPSGKEYYAWVTDPVDELEFARKHFFLPVRFRDPFGSESRMRYDKYDLLLWETLDTLGNRVTSGDRDRDGTITNRNDYRVLQSRVITDINRNRTEVIYDTLGMVVGSAVHGKKEDNDGDLLVDFEPDLEPDVVQAVLSDPITHSKDLLGHATSRHIYDYFTYTRSGEPAVLLSLKRTTHDSQEALAAENIHHEFSFFRGGGQVIQVKSQIEKGRVPLRGPDGSIVVGEDGKPQLSDHPVNSRWVSSGWGIVNNKGHPVQVFEPFFSDLSTYEPNVRIGQPTTQFYDALGRSIATVFPDGTYSKTVFGPWKTIIWDANDTVLDSPISDPDISEYTLPYFRNRTQFQTWYEQKTSPTATDYEKKAAAQTVFHARTFSSVYLDSLGREYLRQSHNKTNVEGHEQNGANEQHFGRTEFSVDGQILATRDPVVENGDLQGRILLQNSFDMQGQCLYSICLEKGRTWSISNINGQPLQTWEERGHAFRFEYDALARLVASFLIGDDLSAPGATVLHERFLYGDNHPEAERRNLRGKVFMTLDQAGMATTEQADFKGNPLKLTAHLAKEYKKTIDWIGIQSILPSIPTQEFDPRAVDRFLRGVLEESGPLVSTCSFDGMSRMVSSVLPHVEGQPKTTIKMDYGIAYLIKILANIRDEQAPTGGPDWSPIVASLEYDALGQRQTITYGNGVVTQYDYDIRHRLKHLRTTRDAARRDTGALQDLVYTHDPVGNVTAIEDNAQQTQFFRNEVISPNREYKYDARYRLVQSTGRERLGQSSGAPVPYGHDDSERFEALGNVASALAGYVEQYVYDSVANIKKMRHSSSAGSWTREFEYIGKSKTEPSKTCNQLSRVSVGNRAEVFMHDVRGNVTRYPHLGGSEGHQNVIWDFKDRIAQLDLGGGGRAYYRYNTDGLRVRKVVEKGPHQIERRTYIGEMEIFQRETNGQVVLERETMHMVDDKQRIAMVERRTIDRDGSDRAPGKITRYQLSDHQHSATIEVEGSSEAKVISYEEYSAYGSTTYQARAPELELPKRYRFTSRERDEESGLSYHGARYLAPWLGRWASADPAGLSDGPNLYAYVNANPVRYSDRGGMGGDDELEFDGLKFERQPNQSIEELTTPPQRFGHIDEIEAVGAPGITPSERLRRATDINNRHIEDGTVNTRTKGVRTATKAPLKRAKPVSLKTEPEAVVLVRLGDIPEFVTIWNWILGRTALPGPNAPATDYTKVKDTLNGKLRRAIRKGKAKPIAAAAAAIRDAFTRGGGNPDTLSFDPNKVPPPGMEPTVKPPGTKPPEFLESAAATPAAAPGKSAIPSGAAAAEGEAGFAMAMDVAPATAAKASTGSKALKIGGGVLLVLGAAATIDLAKNQVEKGDYAGAVSEVATFAAPVVAVAKVPKLGGPLVLLGTASHAWSDEGLDYGAEIAIEWSRAGHSDVVSLGAAGTIVTARALKQTLWDDTISMASAGKDAIWNWITK